MKDLSSIDFKASIRFVVRRELKRLGIKVPKNKSNTKQSIECNQQGVFGVLLEKVPSTNIGDNFYYSVPKFLVESCNFLRGHLATDGLFRKSGSVQRQKLLRQQLEAGESINYANPHDVASLIKQFFRQLQEPLLTNIYHDSFIKALRQDTEEERTRVILYICLMFPLVHLHTLQYIMNFATEVAAHSAKGRMGMSNLAIVLTPNLIHMTKKDNANTTEKLLKDQTVVIETLLKNASQIGLVPEEMYERAKMIGDEAADAMVSSGDELDGDHYQRYKNKRVARTRTRTGSITGFIGQSLHKLKTNSSMSSKNHPMNNHRRSKSVKADLMRNKYKLGQNENFIISKDDTELEKFSSHTHERMSLRPTANKRRIMEYNNTAMSPAFKRRTRLAQQTRNDGDSGIGHPTMVSKSTQMFTTTIKPLTPVRPLNDMVKKEHAKFLLSSETEHVTVVDAMTYIASPDKILHEDMSTSHALSTTRYSVCDEVFESPFSGRGNAENGKMRDRGEAQSRVTRRNSSGATSCFHSSPRRRNVSTTKKDTSDAVWRQTNKTPDTENFNPGNTESCVGGHARKSSVSVVDGGLAGGAKHPNPSLLRAGTGESMTPCKHHVATPPMRQKNNVQMKTLLSQKI